jgi:GntR family transcriptional regulator/MocR family aminotransferase
MMRIPLDRQSAKPLYRQVEEFLREQILAGTLVSETRLPATRKLAQGLGVNRITVNAAYAELESQGFIGSRPGSGNYVSRHAVSFPHILRDELSEDRLPAWQRALGKREWLRELPPADSPSGPEPEEPMFRFDAGAGDQRLFPVEEFRKTLQVVLCRDGCSALDYGDRKGYRPLRVTMAQILTTEGIPAHPDQLLVTSGSQQALALTAHLLLRPKDTIVVEEPTYAGALGLFRALGARIVGVPMDGEGLQTDELERMLPRLRPRLIYTVPNFHNPTGVCLGFQRRRHLLELAGRFNVPILEDDYVGDLRYSGHDLPSLKTLDTTGGVIYVRTFSKMLMPGLRIGFILAQGPVIRCLEACKRVHDLASSSLLQRAIEAYINVGRYQAHLRRACHVYRRRRDRMAEALAAHMPEGAHWALPDGGLFLWLQLPPTIDTGELARQAAQCGVGLFSSSRFFTDGGDRPFLRLNFASQSEDTILEGIARLGTLVRKRLTRRRNGCSKTGT